MRYTHTIKRWWPLRVAQSTNRHITLHKRTGWMTNAETRHRHADSPSSQRQRHLTTRDIPCPGHRCFDEFTSRQLGLSQPTPLVSATLIRVTQTSDVGHPKPPGAYYFDSISSTHLQCQRINVSQPTRSKPYCTNRREEESLAWPFGPSLAV